MRMLKTGGVAITLLLGCMTSATACSYPEQPTFAELLANAKSAAIVRIEALRLVRAGGSPAQDDATVVAGVRVVETLFGEPAAVREIRYDSHWCGGFHLDVAGYYVLLSRDNEADIELLPGDPAIVYLFGHYVESHGSEASDSRLLMNLRNFARIGQFPETFPIDAYLAHSWVKSEREPTKPLPVPGRVGEIAPDSKR